MAAKIEYRYLATRPEIPAPDQWAAMLEEIHKANWFTNFGAVSRRLEDRLAARWELTRSSFIMCASGTAAIAAPLIAHGCDGPVICPAFTFPATLAAIRTAGGTPVIADVDPNNWMMSPDMLDRALKTTGARAAVLVAPFGISQDVSDHIETAKAQGAVLVIDNAAGLGMERSAIPEADDVYHAYSLHATKPFGVGEGGAVVGPSPQEPRIRSALNFGLSTADGDPGPDWGINGKMSEMHAAVGLAVLDGIDARLARRRALARRFVGAVSSYPQIGLFREVEKSPWQVFPALMPSRAHAEEFVTQAQRRGMEIRRYYRPSLSRWRNVQTFAPCPNAESLADRMCCIPVYSNANSAEFDEMVSIVTASLAATLGRGGCQKDGTHA